jgi:hypothetical protein
MADRRWLTPALIAGIVVLGLLAGGRQRFAPPAQGSEGDVSISAAQRRATFTFDASVAPVDREVVLGAVSRARPEARRLIGIVDGLVTIHVVPTPQGAAGVTHFDGRDHFDVDLDLGDVARMLGRQGTDRLVLHELGHVIDYALTPADLDRRLDAEIPAGFGCDYGETGGCAPQRERFAETFAKWAMDDIGATALGLGYKVPPPPSLDAWGAPLAALDR